MYEFWPPACALCGDRLVPDDALETSNTDLCGRCWREEMYPTADEAVEENADGHPA